MGASIVDTAVGRVEVMVAGTGTAVLLVHGSPGSWRQLAPLAADLEAEHTVVLPSRPGYGRTPLATGRTPGQQADAYAALLDALALDRAVVVGVSGGAPSAAAFAARHPGRTAALVLCCPLATDRFGVPRILRLVLAPGVGEVLTALDRARRRRRLDDPAALDALVRRELSPAEQECMDESTKEAVVGFLRSHLDAPAGLPGFRNDLAQVRARTGIPAEVAAPTLILHGDADTVVPLDHARAYAEAVPTAVFETVAGAGHGFLLTRRTEILPRLAHFLREHR